MNVAHNNPYHTVPDAMRDIRKLSQVMIKKEIVTGDPGLNRITTTYKYRKESINPLTKGYVGLLEGGYEFIKRQHKYLYKCAYFPGAPPPQTIAAPPDLEGGDNAFNADDVGSGETGFGTFQDESNGADVLRDFC